MPKRAKNQKQADKPRPTQWRLFNLTVNEVRQAFADMIADEVREMINDAVATVRSSKRRGRKLRSRK